MGSRQMSLFEAAAWGTRLTVNHSPSTDGIVDEERVLWLDLEASGRIIAAIQAGFLFGQH